MHLLLVCLLLVICSAERYAVIYSTIEEMTSSELPSTACRVYDLLRKSGYEKKNIVYMLDETDYDMNWSNLYRNWYSRENIYLRDILYRTACDHIDYHGTYVSPSFLMSFLRGREKQIKKLSGLSTVKTFHFTSKDDILVYISDTHGRGSVFYPHRIITPSMVETVADDFADEGKYHKMLWLVEAAYADYAFHVVRNYKNMAALTLKDIAQSNKYTHMFDLDKTKKMASYFQSVWEVNWVSLLPHSLKKNIQFLAQISHSAVLQTPADLIRPGYWGMKEEVDTPMSVFIPSTESNSPVFNVTAKRTSEKITTTRLDETMRENIGSPFPMYFTRFKLQQYFRTVDIAVRTMMLSELEEQPGMEVNMEGCVDFLRMQLLKGCDYYMPIADPVYQAFVTLCQSRSGNGMFIVDFKPYWKNARNQQAKGVEEE